MSARSQDVNFQHFAGGRRRALRATDPANPRLLSSPYMLIPPLLPGENFRAQRGKYRKINELRRAIILIMKIIARTLPENFKTEQRLVNMPI